MRAYVTLLLILALALVAAPAAADEEVAEPEAGEGAPASEETPAAEDRGPVEIPGPWIYARDMLAVAGWPSGLLNDARLQIRGPLHRSHSIVFQDTHIGAGFRFAATPAFVDIGPRFTIAPIDIFDVELSASYVFFWPSSSGLIPYDDVDDPKKDLDRKDRWQDPDIEVPPGHAFHAMVAPTIKLKFGPIILLDAWTFHYYRIAELAGDNASDYDYVYEPFTDRMLDREEDLVIEQQVVVMGEILDGDTRPLLRVGATWRDRMTLAARDRSMNVGGIFMLKPGYRRGWPTIIVQVLPYVMDHQRLGHGPNVQVALSWANDYPIEAAARGAVP